MSLSSLIQTSSAKGWQNSVLLIFVRPGNLALGVQAGDGKIVVSYKPVTRFKFET